MKVDDLPEAEQRAAQVIEDNLRDLSQSSRDLSFTIALYDFSQEQDQAARGQNHLTPSNSLWSPWMFIAARNGALSIRNFGQALGTVQRTVGLIPSWADKVDRKRIKAVRKRFDSAFPNIDKVRHSIAHPELYSDPTKAMGTSNSDIAIPVFAPNAHVTMQSTLMGNKFMATFEGLVVSYDVTPATALILVDLTTECYDAVKAVDSWPRLK